MHLNSTPDLAGVHYRYGLTYLLPLERTDDAISELKKAVEEEPYSLIIGANLAAVYMYARKPDESLSQAQEITFDLEQNYTATRLWLGHSYLVNKEYDKAISLCKESLQSDESEQIYLWVLGNAYAKSGRKKEAFEVIEKYKNIAKRSMLSLTGSPPFMHLLMGRKNQLIFLK